MSELLSIKAKNEEIEIQASRSDIAAALVRGIVGVAPVIGPMLAEAISAGIPNQKLERVIIFIKVLEDKLKYIEEDVLKQKIKSEQFGDLLEDALGQAARALSDERKEYIANLLKSSLTETDLDHIGKKKLLTLLNEVNDAEIILLHFYSLTDQGERDVMIHKYPFIKRNLEKYQGEPVDERDTLFTSFKSNLVMKILTFGNSGPEEKPTALGLVLLRYIGLR